MKNRKLQLKSESIRTLSTVELNRVAGGNGFQPETSERESIVYWCPGNTSIQRSCSSCA